MEQTTYLGVTFDNKMAWIPHITNKFNKGIRCLQACAKAIGKTWGISPASIRWLYNQVILPSVTYAVFVWYKSLLNRQYLIDLANRLHRNAALLITRGLRSTPIANLEIAAGLPPITLTLQELAIKTARRLKEQGRWDNNYSINTKGHLVSHAYHLDCIFKQLPITASTHKDYVSKTNILDRKFKTDILNRTEIVPYIDSLDSNIWCIYTDGSKRDNLTGAGFCVIHNNQTVTSQAYPLGTYPSVFQCELFAIHEAALWIQANVNSPSTLIIFSDSQAAINTLNSTSVSNTIALDTINTLNELGSLHSITIQWVPGHSNIAGNEAADTLANQGSAVIPTGPEPYLPFSKNQSDTEIRALTFSKHLDSYRNNTLSDKGKIPLLIYLKRYRYTLTNLSSIHIKWLTWVLSGHSPLYYFQHKIGKVFSPQCPHCYGEPETSEHYLGQCVRYATIRLRTFGHITMTWTELLSHSPALIIRFISSTDRFNTDRIFTDRTII